MCQTYSGNHYLNLVHLLLTCAHTTDRTEYLRDSNRVSIVLQVRAGMNRETGNYEIITDDTYQPHQQVFISYGPHDNRTLFLNYGFTLPHNIHNNVSFSVGEDICILKVSDNSVTCNIHNNVSFSGGEDMCILKVIGNSVTYNIHNNVGFSGGEDTCILNVIGS